MTDSGEHKSYVCRVVEQVAELEGVAHEELDPLANAIDPELLQKFDEAEACTDCELRLRYHQ